MNVTVTKKNLRVRFDRREASEARTHLAELQRDRVDMMLREVLTDGYNLRDVPPEFIGALTSQPLFADAMIENDGALTIYGPIFGFPDYAIRDELEELATGKAVRFPIVATCASTGETFPNPY